MIKRKDTRNYKIHLIKVYALIAIILVVLSIIFSKTKNSEIISSELNRYLAYEVQDSDDDKVYDTNNVLIPELSFNAFTLRDTDGDGYGEKYNGCCQEIGTRTNLYMEIALSEGGTFNDDVIISFNGVNCNFNGTIVKDNEIEIGSEAPDNATFGDIKLSSGLTNFQKLIFGSITSNLGNNINRYSSSLNSVTISGSLVNSYGETKTFYKRCYLTVDWYGKVDASFYMPSRTASVREITDEVNGDGLEIIFGVTLEETRAQLLLESMNISGVIPDLAGYRPTKVKIKGTNVEYTYNEETGEFTAKRKARVNEFGRITQPAYSTKYYHISRCTFNFEIVYPIDAYETLAGKTEQGLVKPLLSFEMQIPVEGYVTGYNTSLEGFSNPEKSNIAKTIVTARYTRTYDIEFDTTGYDIDVFVGQYSTNPYSRYEISKEKPLSIYNGIVDSTTDDCYDVTWRTFTYSSGEDRYQGFILQEQKVDEETKADTLRTVGGADISMEDMLSVTKVGFGNASSVLGTNGWIKIYDNDTNSLIKEIKGREVDTFTYSKRLSLGENVKSIRVETSPQVGNGNYFYVYQTKEIDDEYLTTMASRDEFDEYVRIYSILHGQILGNGGMLSTHDLVIANYAYYEAAKSKATIRMAKSYISAHEITKDQKITIETVDDSFNMAKWLDGEFLVQFPAGIVDVEILNYTISNDNVDILAYDLYTEEIGREEIYFLKVITKNKTEEAQLYSIDFYVDLAPDVTRPLRTRAFELYATSKNGYNYVNTRQDIYDVNSNSNTTETVQYNAVAFTIDPGNSLCTTQVASNYNDENSVAMAPKKALVEKEQRTATVTISATNNYTTPITNLAILGVIPFEGNKYLLTNRPLESEFSTTMAPGGITLTTSSDGIDISGRYKVYYSENEYPTNEVTDPENGWIEESLIDENFDWTKVKTYLIVLDSSATDDLARVNITTRQKVEFSYDIELPEGIAYNKTTYSQHAIYFDIVTEDGLLATKIASQRLGFMISRQFTLNIEKTQIHTNKLLQGMVFSLTEEGQNKSVIRTTNMNGQLSFKGIYAQRTYILKEIGTTNDYDKIDEELKIYVYTVEEDGEEELHLKFVDDDERSEIIGELTPTGYAINMHIENDVKLRLKVKKTNTDDEILKNIKFVLRSSDSENTYRTNSQGEINVSGLDFDTVYSLEEVEIKGHYIPSNPIEFKVINNDGSFYLENVVGNESCSTSDILLVIDDYIPTATLNICDEKIPTYNFQITKYAKGETDPETGNDLTLQNAQFRIYGPGITKRGKLYTTDENGVITISNLYEYVNDGYKSQVDAIYTLVEVYAPEGYALDTVPLKFRAQRIDGNLTLEPLNDSGEVDNTKTKLIRNITVDEESIKDISYTNRDSSDATINIGIENEQIFRLFKYYMQDGEKIPIEDVAFTITDTKGSAVYGSDGKLVGEEKELSPEIVEQYQLLSMVNDETYPWVQREDGMYESMTNGTSSSTTTLKTTQFEIKEKSTLTYKYGVSSESGYDIFTLKLNSTSLVSASGNSGTTYESVTFTNGSYTLSPGKYVLTATYTKDYSVNSGMDKAFIGDICINGEPIEQIIVTDITPAVTEVGLRTNENGIITANLPQGFYKFKEIRTGDAFVKDEEEYSFGIDQSQEAREFNGEFSINGFGSVYIESIAPTDDNGVINVGSFEKYPEFKKQDGILGAVVYNEDGTVADNGIDVNGDQKVDLVSNGDFDGMITRYAYNGVVQWTKSFGGSGDDQLLKIIPAIDDGYIICGHVSSDQVFYDGNLIPEISFDEESYEDSPLKSKDGVILKINEQGELQFAIRVGGKADEYLKSLTQDNDGNIYVSGEFKSTNFYCFDTQKQISNVNFEDLNTVTCLVQNLSNSYDGTYDLRGVVLKYDSTGKLLAAQKETKVQTSSQHVTRYYDIEVNDYGLYLAMSNTSDNYMSPNSTSSYVYRLNKETLAWEKSITVVNASESQHVALAKDQNGNIVVGTNYGSTNEFGQYDSHISVIDCQNNDAVTTKYTLTSTSDDCTMSDLAVNSTGGIIITGVYYSQIYSDGDISLPKPVVTYGCNGYAIEFDRDYTPVQWTYCYGDENDNSTNNNMTQYDGFNVPLCCTYAHNGIPYFGGWFEGSVLYVSNPLTPEKPEPHPDDETEYKKVTTKTRDTDGFMIACGEAKAEIPEQRYFEIENVKKEFNIQTQVNLIGSELGGDINGQTDLTQIERVTYGENATIQIVVSPDTLNNYILNTLKINGQEITNYETQADGTIIIEPFENVTQDILVEADFTNSKSKVIENHYLWTGDVATSLTKLQDTITTVVDVGTIYTTNPLNNSNYSLITNEDYYQETMPEKLSATDSYIPTNATGYVVADEVITVNYYYTKNPYTLTVMHLFEGTTDFMVDINGDEIPATITNVALGDSYTTTPYADINYDYYELVEEPENSSGTIERSVLVAYYYRPRILTMELYKVAQENRSHKLEGTDFALYEYIGSDEDYTDDMALDGTHWASLKVISSSSNGLVELSNLSIDKKYKLIETTPTEGRNAANGNWNITFTTENKTQSISTGEFTIQTENTYIDLSNDEYTTFAQISPVGNPVIIDTYNGEVQLANLKSLDLPQTGSIKVKTKYILGLVLIVGVFAITLLNRKNNKQDKNK